MKECLNERKRGKNVNLRFIYQFLISEVIMQQETREKRETVAKSLAEMLAVVPRFNRDRFLSGYLKNEERRSRIDALGK